MGRCQVCFVHSVTSLFGAAAWSHLILPQKHPWAWKEGELHVIAKSLSFLLPGPEPCQKDMWVISEAGAYPTARVK